MTQLDTKAGVAEIAAAAAEPRAWIEPAARAGFAARALVYATVGVLAAEYALGIGGRPTDLKGALEEYSRGAIGIIVLGLLAVGFAGYALWRGAQSFADTESKGTKLKGLAVRTGYLGSGLVNAGLSIASVRILFGERLGDDEGARDWAARLLAAPYGKELLMAVGVSIVLFALWQFYKALSEKYRKRLEEYRMNNTGHKWMQAVSKVGLSARGLLYLVAGVFVMSAAINANPSETRDIGQVLATVQQQPYGNALLFIVAIGLLAYAGYAVVNAIYRQVDC